MQAVSTYQLLELIVYRNNYINLNEKVILFIPEWLNVKIVNISALENYFYKIILFNFSPDYLSSKIVEDIVNYYDCIFAEHKVDFEDVEEFHVAGAHYGIGSYLCLKERNFVLWEDAAGVIAQPNILRDIESNLSISRLSFNENLGIIDGSSPYIYKIFANLNMVKDFQCEKAEHFDVVDELKNIEVEKRNNIISIFIKKTQIEIPKNSVLLLTEHFANCKRLTFEEQVLIYQMYFDYFLQGKNVVIKPHPDDLMYYDQLFKNVTIIRDKFPSEFMEYIFDNKPNYLATISSASVKTLFKYFPGSLIFDNTYEKLFRITHKYYCVMEMMNEMCEYSNIKKTGTYDLLLDNLHITNSKSQKNVNCLPDIKVSVVDDYNTELISKYMVTYLLDSKNNECFFLINSKEKYLFYELNKPEVWNYILPIRIKKYKLDVEMKDCYCDEDDELMYFFSKNEMLRKCINDMKIKKKLDNTGMYLEKEVLDENNLEIEILKGKLDATEKRLKYYIELVESMEKESK